MKIFYENGFAIDKNVEAVVNSANGYLLLGSSGAGRIRDLSRKLNLIESLVLYLYLFRLNKKVRLWFLNIYKKNKWNFTLEQLDCLSLIVKNSSHPYNQGNAVMGSIKVQDKIIIHAIGIGIIIDNMINEKRIVATIDVLRKAVRASFNMARENKIKTIAIPVMCVRDGYGIEVKESVSIIEEELHFFKNDFDSITICFDNDKSETYLSKNFLTRTNML